MSAGPNIEAVAVIIKVDGRTTLAPIDPAGAQLFVGMIAAFQAGAPKETKLIVLPEHVVQHVEAMGVALREAITSRAPKGGEPSMSADTTPGLEAERAAFEAVFSAPPYEFDLARHPENSAWPGSYRSYHVQCTWDAWQEGRRGVTPAASGLSDLEISAHIKRAIPSLIGDAMALRVARAVLARWGAPAASGEPVARKPLTDEQIATIASTPCAVPGSYVHAFARAIEAAHSIKP